MGNTSQHQFSADTLNRWYRTPLGRRVAIEERELLESELPRLFGYNLLQIGGASLSDALECSPIQQKIVLGDEGSVMALAELLPIESDSVDLVILPHAIELANDPQQLLREVERVLIPEGHLLVFSFNPWSLWGLRRLLTRAKDQFPWSARYLSSGKLGEWLSLLGFERVRSHYHLFELPLQRPFSFGGIDSIFNRYFPRIGGGYCLLVRKRVSTLTPIKPGWGNRKRVVGLGLNGSPVRRERD